MHHADIGPSHHPCTSRREWLAIAGVLLLSAILQLARLGEQGWGNPYYAATVRSMLLDRDLWFFASFDPAGWVSVDKPPFGFWVQSASSRLFGFHGWALLLPQALATIGSVALIWRVVRDRFGPVAGVLSALVLALTPITVATGRTNTIDPLLVLVLLIAVWALQRAIDRSALRWLLLSGAMIGIGFLTKMLQAYLVLPAWAAAWVLADAMRSWRRRTAALVAAGLVVVVVSASWLVIVDRTPASERPYVGSSSGNSAIELAIGYNGLQRLLGDRDETSGAPSPGRILSAFGAIETGSPGPLRLFNPFLAAQASWLLVVAIVGGMCAWRVAGPWLALPLGRAQAALVLWGGWLLTAIAFFSVAAQFHRYYLVMLGPPIAALTGIGAVDLWTLYRRPGVGGWVLPGTVGACTAIAMLIVARVPGISAAVLPVTLIIGAISTVLLIAGRLVARVDLRRTLASLGCAAAVIALAIGPAIWSSWSVTHPVDSTLPAAGPGTSLVPSLGGSSDDANAPSFALDRISPPDPATLAFLNRNHRTERFPLATLNAMSAAPYIIYEAMPVAALGGFVGQDPIVSPPRLRQMIERGDVRFVLLPDQQRVSMLVTATGVLGRLRGEDAGAAATDPQVLVNLFQSPLATMISKACERVPDAEWRSPDAAPVLGLGALDVLYDCRPDLPRNAP